MKSERLERLLVVPSVANAWRTRMERHDEGSPRFLPAVTPCSRAVHWPPSCAVGYPVRVSPTVLRVRGFRFYFFSREERRRHVHVQHADGEAKFWIDPAVELHANYGLKPKQIAEAEKLVEEHLHEIRSAWAKHFPG